MAATQATAECGSESTSTPSQSKTTARAIRLLPSSRGSSRRPSHGLAHPPRVGLAPGGLHHPAYQEPDELGVPGPEALHLGGMGGQHLGHGGGEHGVVGDLDEIVPGGHLFGRSLPLDDRGEHFLGGGGRQAAPRHQGVQFGQVRSGQGDVGQPPAQAAQVGRDLPGEPVGRGAGIGPGGRGRVEQGAVALPLHHQRAASASRPRAR